MIHIELNKEDALFLAIHITKHAHDEWLTKMGKDQEFIDLAKGIGDVAQGLYDVAGGAGKWRVT
jgi:hypothetical protein